MAQRISIVDYGMGNLRSVQKALAHVAPEDTVEVTSDPQAVRGGKARRFFRLKPPGLAAVKAAKRGLDRLAEGTVVSEVLKKRA